MKIYKEMKSTCIITVSFGGSQFILPDPLAKETLQFIVDKQKRQCICD